nr:cupin-like domain-containing protein [Thalassotalea insulae]
MRNWPVVDYANHSYDRLSQYLTSNHTNEQVGYIYSEGQQGRLFYNEDFSGVNYQSYRATFSDVINKILKHSSKDTDSAYYMSSAPLKRHLPKFLDENYNDFLNQSANPNIWISNKITVATHFDVPDNIACCISGKRKFTLFPPEQISNLYVGPLDITPAGQPISLVDIRNPDYQQFPKFKQALKQALIAELTPGDALYIPSLWWHNVESLDHFNVLLTFFHDATPPHYGSALNSLLHGLMSIRNLPPHKKHAWQSFFNHYIFSDSRQRDLHIPAERLGILGQQTPEISNALKKILTMSMN